MKREIKFRGKRIDNGQWVYGFYHYSINWNCDFIREVKQDSEGVIEHDVEVDPETVGQFTGLLDKNGKEIYEGDIYRAYGRICQVVFLAGAFAGKTIQTISPLGWSVEEIDSGDCLPLANSTIPFTEVIGNIYDNPELLK